MLVMTLILEFMVLNEPLMKLWSIFGFISLVEVMYS